MKIFESRLKTEIVQRNISLSGLTNIMFDRYAGDNNTKLTADQKLYLSKDGIIALPSLNLRSFMSAHNTNSAPKRLRDKRKYKDIANAMLSFCDVQPDLIEFTRDGKPIKFNGFNGSDEDKKAGLYIHRGVARLDKGIPNPKERPVLITPWQIRFTMTLYPNSEIKEQEIFNLFEEGGRAIGLGTFRGVFGKFEVTEWA